MNHLEKTTLLQNAINEKVAFDSEVATHRTNARIEAEKELVDHAINEKVEELKKGALDWKNALTGRGVVGILIFLAECTIKKSGWNILDAPTALF